MLPYTLQESVRIITMTSYSLLFYYWPWLILLAAFLVNTRHTNRRMSMAQIFTAILACTVLTFISILSMPAAPSKNYKNTMIIATYPSSGLRLTAIWSQLACFTESVDRIILSAPDEEWSHRALTSFVHRMKHALPPAILRKINLRFFTNDRYDAGLWCDALQEENIDAFSKSENTNYLLINDSIMAIRQYDGLFNFLVSEKDLSLVSLNYWLNNTEGEDSYWLESAARAFSSRGIQIYREKVCQNLNETIGNTCARKKSSLNRKRCVVEHTEIAVASYYNQNETRGLYPGMVPDHMITGS